MGAELIHADGRMDDMTKLPCTTKFTENTISVNSCSYNVKQLHRWFATHRLKNITS